MSKLVLKRIYIPELLSVETNTFANGLVCWISGPYSTLKQRYYPTFSLHLQKKQLSCSLTLMNNISNFFHVTRKKNLQQKKIKLSNLYIRTQQLFISTSVGFKNFLRIRGVGYKFAGSATQLTMEVGYSHLLSTKIPFFRSFLINKKANLLRAQAPNLIKVNTFFAATRFLRQPDVYKGKGIRYKKEYASRKEGKKKKTN